MTQPYNWSERGESPQRDCTYASGLTGMVYAGWTKFPKGIYTHEEREALERSDSQPDETGASLADLKEALKNRYGVTRTINAASALSGLLDKRMGHVVQGYLKNFPSGHRLRRWQPGFTGGHAIFVYFGSDLKYHWFDPLAPMKFAGDIVTKAEIMTFAKGLGGSISFRPDEFKVVAPVTYTQAQLDAAVSSAVAPLTIKIADLQAMLNHAAAAAASAQNAAATAQEALEAFKVEAAKIK